MINTLLFSLFLEAAAHDLRGQCLGDGASDCLGDAGH